MSFVINFLKYDGFILLFIFFVSLKEDFVMGLRKVEFLLLVKFIINGIFLKFFFLCICWGELLRKFLFMIGV